MRLYTHIVILYLLLAGVMVVFVQHSREMTSRGQMDASNAVHVNTEMETLRKKLDCLELDAEKHKIEDERSRVMDGYFKDNINQLKNDFREVHGALVKHCQGAK